MLFRSAEVPRSLIILGAGAVGVEFASIYSRFGSAVTLIELLPRIVPTEDDAVSIELSRAFRRQGITVLTGTQVRKAVATEQHVELEVQTPDGKMSTHVADILLVAAGVVPLIFQWVLQKSENRYTVIGGKSVRPAELRLRSLRGVDAKRLTLRVN